MNEIRKQYSTAAGLMGFGYFAGSQLGLNGFLSGTGAVVLGRLCKAIYEGNLNYTLEEGYYLGTVAANLASLYLQYGFKLSPEISFLIAGASFLAGTHLAEVLPEEQIMNFFRR